ncbi:MAG: TonB-dependent receptor domain-containing protein, partial [Bacteroidia bacterium]
MKKIFFIVLLLSISVFAKSQQLSDIKVKEYFYYVPLNRVFDTLQVKYHLKIVYDSVLCSSIKFTYTFSGTDGDLVFNNICRHNNLKYSVSADGVITIESNAPPPSENKEKAESVANSRYKGSARTSNFTLSGILKDRTSGEALPFATIYIKGTSNAATTNADGYFTLLKVPYDTCTLSIAYIGYEKAEFYLSPDMPKTNLVVEISASHVLKEVVVTTSRYDLMNIGSKSDVSTIKMSPQKLASLPNLGEKDILRSFQLMPGIGSSNESSSGLYVRGGTPDQNLVLYDGFTVYHVDHLYGFFSAFNSNAIKDVELYKGGFESRFGGRLSSVMEITSKDGNQKNFNVGADLSLLSVNAFAEIPIGDKFSSSIAVRRSYHGYIYRQIFNDFNDKTQHRNNGGFGRGGGSAQASSYFYDLNAKLTYRPTKKDIISLSFFNSTDDLDNSYVRLATTNPYTLTTSPSFSNIDLTKYGNLGTSLKWSRKWGSRFYGNTLLSYSNYYSRRDLTNEGSFTSSAGVEKTFKMGTLENNNLKDYSFKTDYVWDAFKNNQIQFGAFATYFDIAYSYSQNDTTTVLDRRNYGVLAGGYLQDKIKLFNSKLQFTPGVRWSSFSETNKSYTEPRFSAIYNITDHLSLKAATGKFYQFANRVTREDILSGSRDFWILSDGNKVPVSSAIHYILGTSYETNNFLFSVEGYYKILSNIADYSLRFSRAGQAIQADENFYTGTGLAKGVEFLLQKKYGNLSGWVSYTLGRVRDHFDVYSDKDFPASQDVTHEFKIVTMYNWKRWNFAATWIYATGEPYTAPSGAYTL